MWSLQGDDPWTRRLPFLPALPRLPDATTDQAGEAQVRTDPLSHVADGCAEAQALPRRTRVSLAGKELQWVSNLADHNGWPVGVAEACYETFGARIFNGQGRTFKSLNRRIVHTLRVWEEKYGPFNEAQEQYASKVLTHAVVRARAGADGAPSLLYPYVLAAIARMVNHEKVDAGFKRRAEMGDLDLLDDLLKRVPA